MFKISHVNEIPTIVGVPQEVIDVAKNIVIVLDREYGTDRDPFNDDGGYVVILSPNDDLSVLKDIGLDVGNLFPESIDVFPTTFKIEYIHATMLFNNEFSCHILMPKCNAPVNFLD